MSVSGGRGKRNRRRIILLQGSQASLACPSDKNIMKVKALERLEVLAWDKYNGIIVFWLDDEWRKLER
jgi:hypothetical protein